MKEKVSYHLVLNVTANEVFNVQTAASAHLLLCGNRRRNRGEWGQQSPQHWRGGEAVPFVWWDTPHNGVRILVIGYLWGWQIILTVANPIPGF